MLEVQLYPLRWLILVVIAVLQVMCAFSFSYGQVNNVYVAYFNVSYETVDWMMNGAFLGSSLVSPLLIWASGKDKLRFRRFLILGSGSVTLCYLLNGLAAWFRHVFSLALIGQIAIGVAIVVMDTIAGVFAVQWFPNHQVGTAIGVNLMGYSSGGIIGSFIFTTFLKSPVSVLNASKAEGNLTMAFIDDRWISSVGRTLMSIDFTCFLTAALILLFVCAVVPDTPPLAPTVSQALKRQQNADEDSQLKRTILQQTKELFGDKVYLILTLFYAVMLDTFDLELAFLSETVRSFKNDLGESIEPEVLGGYLIVANTFGSLVGNIVAAKVIDKTDRYLLMTRIASVSAFCASLSLILGFRYSQLLVIFASNSLLGISTGICLVGVYELLTQQTYPADETFITLWMVVVDNFVGLVIMILGRCMLSSLGPFGALGFISGLLFVSVFIICIIKPINKRRKAGEETADDEQTFLVQGHLKSTDNIHSSMVLN